MNVGSNLMPVHGDCTRNIAFKASRMSGSLLAAESVVDLICGVDEEILEGLGYNADFIFFNHDNALDQAHV